MTAAKGNYGIWENPNLVVIDGELEGPPQELIERWQRRDWGIAKVTGDIKEAFAMLQGEASAILIYDRHVMPASYIMRQILMDPYAVLTPIMVLTHDKAFSSERKVLETMGSLSGRSEH